MNHVSFAGVGLGKEHVDILASRVLKSRPACNRWRSCAVLVIDEVSMVDGAFFDKLEAVARMARHNNRPFGGVQLVLSGEHVMFPAAEDAPCAPLHTPLDFTAPRCRTQVIFSSCLP